MAERYELPPDRLERWLARWAQEHGEGTTLLEPAAVTFTGADGATVVCEPPFPPLDAAALGSFEGMLTEALLEHARRPRRVGVLLVRLGGHTAGVFDGGRVVAHRTGSRNVHGRHRAGGSSQRRFERRRGEQARVALQAAADTAAGVLLPHVHRLDAVVLGGDKAALSEVMADRRLAPLAALACERVIEVPEPRFAVLERTPAQFTATIVRPV